MRFAASTRKLAPIYAQNNTRTLDDNSHAAIPMRSATGDSKTPYNDAHTSRPKAASSHHYTAARKKGKPTAAATAAQTRYLSSPAAATLHGKTQGFVPRLPPQNYPHATFMQPFQCDLQPQLQITHRTAHIDTTTCCRTQRYLSSPAAATWHWKTRGFVLRLPPQLTTCLRHHFPS